ncbi:MAG: hypothetical protein JW909_04480 [Planctomycetes bacterium]|nr:hypothetical protein [Planctomycetota bacterium]
MRIAVTGTGIRRSKAPRGNASRRKLIVQVMIRAACEDFVGAYLTDQDALELLGDIDGCSRTWGAATALACFRKVLAAADSTATGTPAQ